MIDYVTKYCLATTVTTTCRGVDALRCVDLAVPEAQRLLNLTDLRGDRGVMDIIDAAGGIGQAPAPIALVSDNGSSCTFRAAFDGDDPVLCPVRTRVRSPQTNGVVERCSKPSNTNTSTAPRSTTATPSPWKSGESARSTTTSDPTKLSATTHHDRRIYMPKPTSSSAGIGT